MKLSELKNLIMVVDEKSFSKAANKLYISQPSLTFSIKQLEKELGKELIKRKRGGRDLTLTPDGKFVYEHAKKIMHEIDLIITFEKGVHEKVKLGIPSIIGANLFPKIVHNIDTNLLKNIDLIETGSAHMKELLITNKVKIAIMGSLRPISKHNSFDSHFIMKDRYVLFVPSNHCLAKRKNVSFSEIKNENFISMGNDYLQYYVLKHLFSSEHIAPSEQNVTISNEFETVNALISNGAGLGIMTTYSLGQSKGIKMVPLKENIYCYFYMIFKKEKYLDSLEKQVKNSLINADLGKKLVTFA
ncbi:LysR family transcriptional regulator [Lactobacillus sp. ESL0791]|uniref:LysR family transcriptional regulator n=1 Tax=Lactobacillus sp. ESL0791 TaxID=2983234 RepID=UPI0023F71E26|nr:LysR family transcriptional regulator [Lactobacillus sp. ESL0791]MDF7637927.1 LysR family transcriptional regulator [Lactobacillus sp. ESL0791]